MMAVADIQAQIVEEPQITALMNRWKNYNLENQELRGWRIQIMASTDRRQMETARRIFERRYPEYGYFRSQCALLSPESWCLYEYAEGAGFSCYNEGGLSPGDSCDG